MIKILFVSGIPGAGGTEAVMDNIFSEINREVFIIDFLFIGNENEDNSELTKKLKKMGGTVYYAPRLKYGIMKHRSTVKNIILLGNYDIVHSHLDASGTEILKIAEECDVKVRISHSHNTDYLIYAESFIDKLHKLYLEIQRKRISQVATHYIGCSDAAGKWLFGEKICGTNKYITLKNSIRIDDYVFSNTKREIIRKKLNIEDKIVIGHIGRFDAQKNHPFLIRIFKKYNEIEPSSIMLLAGDGKDRNAIQEQSENLGLKDKIMFLGNIDYISDMLQACDLFLLPSLYEGLSIALVEAQASGLPCLVSDTVTIESNISGNVRFLGLDNDEQVWAEKMQEMIRQKRSRVEVIGIMKKAGFDIKTNIINLEKFYIDALEEVI